MRIELLHQPINTVGFLPEFLCKQFSRYRRLLSINQYPLFVFYYYTIFLHFFNSSPPPIPMFYMFEVQIPVDAYPVFGLKRRSLLFVIDKKQTLREGRLLFRSTHWRTCRVSVTGSHAAARRHHERSELPCRAGYPLANLS